MVDSKMVILLLSEEAQGYWVTIEKTEGDLHSPVTHAMEWSKTILIRTVEERRPRVVADEWSYLRNPNSPPRTILHILSPWKGTSYFARSIGNIFTKHNAAQRVKKWSIFLVSMRPGLQLVDKYCSCSNHTMRTDAAIHSTSWNSSCESRRNL